MKTSSQHSINDRGSTLLFVLMFMGIMSVIYTSVWATVAQKNEISKKTKIMNSRDLVVISALRNARVATFYYNTIVQNSPTNQEMIKCLIDDSVADPSLLDDCVAYTVDPTIKKDYLFDLVDTTEGTTRRVLGTPSDPVRYDIFGQTCAAASVTCPFQAYTSYKVTCLGDTATCSQAEYLEVSVTVQVDTNYQQLFSTISATTSTKDISIRDFHKNNFPLLPPVYYVPAWGIAGAAISDGAGLNGWIKEKIDIMLGVAPPPPAGGPAGAPPPPSPTTGKACHAGQDVVGGKCSSFSF